MAKNENKVDDTIELEVMPGADPISEEDAKPFEVDMNFENEENEEDEVEFPKEEEIEEVEEPKAEEEPSEVPEEDEEEEDAEATDEEGEDPAEEEVLAEDEGDTQQPDEPVQERTEEPKEPMIPKSRFDEVLAKQKALAKKVEELSNPIEKIDKAPDFDFEAKELEYQDMILNGQPTEAAKVRAEIRAAEKQTMMFEVQNQMGQTVQQSTETIKLQQKAAEIAENNPILDEGSPEYDEVKTQEVLGLRDAYIIQGYEGADALQKAVDLLMPTSIDPAPINEPDPVQQQVTQKKKVANTKNKLKAANKQPPALKGKNKVEKKVDINTMSVEEFDALPAETLRRMRGDFG